MLNFHFAFFHYRQRQMQIFENYKTLFNEVHELKNNVADFRTQINLCRVHLKQEWRLFLLSFFSFFSIRYHRSSSSITCHMYHHVGGRRHTPVVCSDKREPHTSHYTSRPVTKKNNQQTTQTSHYAVDR